MTNFDMYSEFVDGLMAPQSKGIEQFILALRRLENANVEPARLFTAMSGLSGEVGEFNDIIKKIIFHNREFNEEKRQELKKELGDIIWYWMAACQSLGLDADDVINTNVKKLESRYPGGKFSMDRDLNRNE